MAHRLEIKVRFYEIDPYGHLNHSAFIQYFETGRVELLEEVGLGLSHFREQGYQFVVSGIETDFLKTVHEGDTVIVETEVIELRRASSIWQQRLLRDGEVVARQKVRAAITDDNGKPTRPPDTLEETLRPYFADS